MVYKKGDQRHYEYSFTFSAAFNHTIAYCTEQLHYHFECGTQRYFSPIGKKYTISLSFVLNDITADCTKRIPLKLEFRRY